ncbi:Uncharacterised protein [Salmonella enterica subsp. arizonae]|uniref:Uncharacterized protein n=1 Tax=Salmonella enterica subsp. arizonae TaxID=59203 RepID=A0A447R4U8_SALER|nr:Uncharacterised protein [Salmonella enterica subsp. arizonae]
MAGRTFRFNPDQALRLWLVFVRGHHAVAVLPAQLLPGGGIRQGLHDNLFRTILQRQPSAREQACHIVCHPLPVTLCIRRGQHRPGGVSGGQGGEPPVTGQRVPDGGIRTLPVGHDIGLPASFSRRRVTESGTPVRATLSVCIRPAVS